MEIFNKLNQVQLQEKKNICYLKPYDSLKYLKHNCVQIISIWSEYLKPYNCGQIISILKEYLKPYNYGQIISILKEYLKPYNYGQINSNW